MDFSSFIQLSTSLLFLGSLYVVDFISVLWVNFISFSMLVKMVIFNAFLNTIHTHYANKYYLTIYKKKKEKKLLIKLHVFIVTYIIIAFWTITLVYSNSRSLRERVLLVFLIFFIQLIYHKTFHKHYQNRNFYNHNWSICWLYFEWNTLQTWDFLVQFWMFWINFVKIIINKNNT